MVTCDLCGKTIKKKSKYYEENFCSKNCAITYYHKRRIRTFNSLVVKTKKCWGWSGKRTTHGYASLCGRSAHRYSYVFHKGIIPKNKHVLHKCDNRTCTNPDHLYLGSHQDNMKDMIERKRYEHGERHHGAKLKNVDILNIIKLIKRGEKQYKIARKYNIYQSVVSRIKYGKAWKHAESEV